MVVSEFIHFYPGYTVTTALNEYARVFNALVADMYRIRAREGLRRVAEARAANGDNGIVDEYQKEAEGAQMYIRQSKVLRSIKNAQ